MAEFINTIDVLGDDAVIDSIINRTIAEFKDNVVTKIGEYAFYNCKTLKTVELPNVGTVSASYAFQGCTALERVNLPKFDADNSNHIKGIFAGCKSLEEISFPSLRKVGYQMMEDCTALRKVDLGCADYIHQYAFNRTALDILIIRTQSVCDVVNVHQGLGSTPIWNGTGYIYVPRALVDSYKAATNWSTVADQFRALEDYTVDGTITGELDETKI